MASSTITTTGPIFSAGGLNSGLDTNSIINSLVAVQSAPVTTNTNIQAAYKTQITEIADLTTKLQALSDAATALKTGGVLGLAQVGSDTGFTATPGSGASAGTYAVKVESLAAGAKARSTSFAAGATVTGSSLSLGVNGTNYDLTVADGSSLEAVASQINQSGAPVIASVLTTTNGTRYLSVNAKDTGFTPGQDPSTALTITETLTGSSGQALGITIKTPASNASINIDGLSFERSSNTISDALPGVTFNLKQLTSAPEDLVLNNDTTATQANLQKFVGAYNTLMSNINANLNIQPTTDRSQTLAGDPNLRSLQTKLQNMISGVLNPTSNSVKTLADVGVTTGSDGNLTIDSTKLGNALGVDATGVNALFQTATTGLADTAAALKTTYMDPVDGLFTNRTKGLNQSVSTLDATIANLNLRLDGYRKTLVAQFAAMETVVGNFKSTATYLTQQAAVIAAQGK